MNDTKTTFFMLVTDRDLIIADYAVNGGVANAPHAGFEVVAFTTTSTNGEPIPFGYPSLRGNNPLRLPAKDAFIHSQRLWLSALQ